MSLVDGVLLSLARTLGMRDGRRWIVNRRTVSASNGFMASFSTNEGAAAQAAVAKRAGKALPLLPSMASIS